MEVSTTSTTRSLVWTGFVVSTASPVFLAFFFFLLIPLGSDPEATPVELLTTLSSLAFSFPLPELLSPKVDFGFVGFEKMESMSTAESATGLWSALSLPVAGLDLSFEDDA